MSSSLTEAQKIRRLPWLLGFQGLVTLAVSLSVFGSVFSLFLKSLGMDKTQIGILFSLLPFLGVLAIFISSHTARLGYKRMTVIFYALRMLFVGLLLTLPLVLDRFGGTGAFVLVAGVILLFGLARVVGESSLIAWMQEAVPLRIRGKYTGMEFLAANIGGVAAFLLAALILNDAQIDRYLWLIGIGVVMGLLAVACVVRVPGGAPVHSSHEHRATLRSIFASLRDTNFRRLLLGIGLALFGITAVMTFLPLYLTERAGFTPSHALMTQNAMFIGVLLFSYFWGWASDRYGSKPVTVIGMGLMSVLLLSWTLLPQHHSLSGIMAVGIFFLMGMANIAYHVSATRQLFHSVPPEKKEHYLPAYYLVYNVSLGSAPLLGGLSLDGLKDWSQKTGAASFDPYIPLFIGSALCCLAAACVFQCMHRRSDMETRKFAGLFVQGNPFTAMGLLVRHRWTGEERQRISFVERLGDIKSPLTASELIEALQNPSFHVRYEAVNSIARTPSRPELIEAMIDLLREGETELRAAAAWALSRMGGKQALPALRETLRSEYPLLCSRAARALGVLGDVDSIDALRDGMQREECPDMKVPYAAALGALRDRASVDKILSLLAEASDELFQAELALALARILGGGHRYSRLWRRVRNNVPADASAILLDLTKPLAKLVEYDTTIPAAIEEASRTLAQEGLEAGGKTLANLVDHLPLFQFTHVAQTILKHAAAQLRSPHSAQPVYIVLILHTLQEQMRT